MSQEIAAMKHYEDRLAKIEAQLADITSPVWPFDRVPPKKEYVNLFRDEVTGYSAGAAHKTLEDAIAWSKLVPSKYFIKTIEVEL